MHTSFTVKTTRRNQLVDITAQVQSALDELSAGSGTITVFCPHTTAGITINENADPSVRRDLIETMNMLVPPDQSHFTHAEGNSDSHMKSMLTGCSEQLLVESGRLVLGTWQAIYFAEFDGPRTRKVHIGFTGETVYSATIQQTDLAT